MKRSIFAVVAIVIMANFSYAQTPPLGLTLPSTSISVTDNVFSTLSNPAWLGYRKDLELLLAFPYTDSTSSENLGIFVKLGPVGFSGEFVNDGAVPYNKYTIAHGKELGAGFYLGSSYTWYRVVDWQGSFNLGLGYRPLPFISAGATIYDLNQPDHTGVELDPSYGLSLALRPINERLTISGDVLFTRNADHDYGENLDPILRVEALPLDGLRLTGEYRTDSRRFGLGLSLAMDNLSLGNYRISNEDGDHLGSVGYLHLTSARQRSFLSPSRHRIVEITLSGEIRETKLHYFIFTLEGKTLSQLRREIIHYADDPTVDGLILKFAGLEMGFAQAQQLRRTLEEFKSSGKKLIAFSEDFTQRDYFLATACDEIHLQPVGSVDLRGLGAVLGYWKGTLDKLGIGVQVVKIGDYKTAANSFTYEDATDAEADMINWLLDDMYNQICARIAEGRGWTMEDVQRIVDDGPYYSVRALETGLVDDVGYYDDITRRLEDDGFTLVKEDDYWKYPDYEEEWADLRIPKVAVIYCEGVIVPGESGDGWFSDPIMGSDTIVEAIRKAREDRSIDAIILRVDSPGGSAIASEAIYREVRRTTTDEENRKPIIVSMGNVAGSGGYYIACAADTIVAEEGTITGSIGVLAGKINLAGLYQKIYYNTHAFKRGEHADAWRMHRPFSDEEMQMLREAIEQVYDDFTTRVAQSRPLTKEEVDRIGQGRVWTGAQAQENGLVDLIGGMDLAFDVVRTSLGVEEGAPLRIEILPKPKGFFARVGANLFQMRVKPLPEDLTEALEPLSLMLELYDGEPLMLMPYEIEVK